MKQKLLEMVQVNVLFHTFPPLTKTETVAKTAPRAPKLGYKGGRAPQSSARGTLGTSRPALDSINCLQILYVPTPYLIGKH